MSRGRLLRAGLLRGRLLRGCLLRGRLLLSALASGAILLCPAPVVAQPADVPAPQGRKTEFGILPLVGGDTDVGFGVGQVSTVAALAPGFAPYRWAIESAAFITFKPDDAPGGSVLVPYQDYFVHGKWLEPLGNRLRAEARISFTRETTQRYYGLGNASPAPAGDDVPARDFFGRTHPTIWAKARYAIGGHKHVGVAGYFTQNWLRVPPDGTLAQQMATGTESQRRILGQVSTHGVAFVELLFLYDSRDNEIVTERGHFHQVKLRLSPALSDALPYAYQQVNVNSRVIATIVPDRLVLAGRVVLDAQFGDPPFYELARYDDTFALGGVNGVRGVPGQRYYGKVKVFGNVEARSQVVAFTLWKKPMVLGIAAFFDAGRAWAELTPHPELDGTGWGIKYGVGGGLRLQQGKTFMARADVAWSPDARPVGAYVTAGQTF